MTDQGMERVPIHLMKAATFVMDDECYPRRIGCARPAMLRGDST
jgi:hypothetical protein